jgi:tetrapyrrole methylase family protein / MazG family protein
MIFNTMKFIKLLETIAALRGKDGCPWDKKQTCSSLAKHIKSECDELLAAIHNNDHNNICEELGDVLYLLVMIAEINSDQGLFDFNDAIEMIDAKLIRRHPHVFAGLSYENEEQLKVQWQTIKAMEKK